MLDQKNPALFSERFGDEQNRDVFAIGVSVWTMLSSHLPFKKLESTQMKFPIIPEGEKPHGFYTLSKQHGLHFAKALTGAIVENSDDRPTVSELIKSLK